MSELILENVSRWYGNVVAVNGVSMKVGPGVTGPSARTALNKSTLIHMMGGFLAPSSGSVTLDGKPIWRNPGAYRSLGLVPERESAYDFLTGEQFITAMAKLHKLPDAVAPPAAPSAWWRWTTRRSARSATTPRA